MQVHNTADHLHLVAARKARKESEVLFTMHVNRAHLVLRVLAEPSASQLGASPGLPDGCPEKEALQPL